MPNDGLVMRLYGEIPFVFHLGLVVLKEEPSDRIVQYPEISEV